VTSFCWTLLGLFLCNSAAAQTVSLVSGEDYAPYADSKMPDGGLATALVKNAFAKVRREVAVDWQPWAFGLKQAKSGAFDATYPYIRTDERAKDFEYSDEIITVRSTAFVKAGNTKLDFSRPESLAGTVYCLPLGWAPTPKLAELLNAGTIQRESPHNISSCAKMVYLGRADYFVYGDIQVAQALRDGDVPPGALVKAAGPPLTLTPLHLMATKELPSSRALVNSFNQGLARSRKDGSYAKIVNSYVP
jgi:polar amino acid transport system substrate-binding protein